MKTFALWVWYYYEDGWSFYGSYNEYTKARAAFVAMKERRDVEEVMLTAVIESAKKYRR